MAEIGRLFCILIYASGIICILLLCYEKCLCFCVGLLGEEAGSSGGAERLKDAAGTQIEDKE